MKRLHCLPCLLMLSLVQCAHEHPIDDGIRGRMLANLERTEHLTAKLESTRGELQEKTKALEDRDRQIKSIQEADQLSSARREEKITNLNAEVVELENQIATLRERESNLGKQIEEATRRNREDLKEASNKLVAAQDENMALKRQVQTLEEDLHTRDERTRAAIQKALCDKGYKEFCLNVTLR